MDGDYRLFARIVESGSLSAAGRAMGLSPAMISKRLARLEARLGTTLVTRTTRRLALTEAGERFHADVQAILAAVEDAEARASGHDGQVAGPLRVSAPTSFGRLHVAPFLTTFLEAHPRLTMELNLSDDFTDLLGDRTDLAIRITTEVGAGLAARRLATSRRILCAAPAYLSRHPAPADIDALPDHHMLAAVGQLPWRLTRRDGRSSTVDGRSRVRTNSSEVVRELAIAGSGIALRSLWDVNSDLAAGRLVRVLPEWEGAADVGIYAVTPRRPWPLAAAVAFSDFLAALYAMPPWEHHGS
ncbi:MAG: LysR family transcriptional regulator [Sphingobium sp.]|nr:MAG: LysR family transcriptional regulator [Sphingobium sp.]